MTSSDRRPVVAGVDASPCWPGVVRWAADEAAHLNRPLRVVHALEAAGPAPADAGGVASDAVIEARQWQPGLDVAAVTRAGPAAGALLAESRDAALVVVGGRRVAGFRALVMGSVGLQVAGHAACPVLVVHHAERWSGPETPLPSHGPIVAGADGSAGAEAALGLAFHEAAARRLPVVAVRAWTRPHHPFGRSPAPADLATAAAAQAREVAAELQPWQVKFPAIRAESRAVEGLPDEVLLAESAGALMVVVGARGLGGFAELRLGGVAQRVLDLADAPVLVARPL